MLKRHGFGASEAIGAVVVLGVTGLVGYSMVSGQCLLGGCDAGKASSAPAMPTATVVSADTSFGCSAGEYESADSGPILASDAGNDEVFVACESATAIASECSATSSCSETAKTDCQSECETDKPLE